jgi:hypothetical protein
MTIPFLDLIRRAKEKFEGKRRPTGLAPLPSVEDKPESDKLAKRVMPYAVRTMTPEPTAPALAAARAIAARRISVTRPSAGAPFDLGPGVGVAVEPRGERTVSLALSDVIAEMPNGYLKPHESFDTSRRITLRAAEVEKGLAAGRPSVLIAAIYHQAPEIFLHTVEPSDTAVVTLPVKKVIDELSHLRVREDQTAEPIMAQVETPFLKMMVEESAKFGTTLAPLPPQKCRHCPNLGRAHRLRASRLRSRRSGRLPPGRQFNHRQQPGRQPRRRPVARFLRRGSRRSRLGMVRWRALLLLHRVPRRKTSRKNLCRLERVGPRFREFQPPAGLPFLPPHHQPLRRREFHSKCRLRLCRRKSRRKRRHPHRRQPPLRFKRRRRLCRLPRHHLSKRRNQWSCFRCDQSWRVSRRCRLPATSLQSRQTRRFRFAWL